jgi:hypothetical protein
MVDMIMHAATALLSGPASGNSLANGLCVSLMRILFDLWLCAPRWSQTLWSRLVVMIPQWRHRRWVVYHWALVCRALTLRILPLLHGANQSELGGSVASSPQAEMRVIVQWPDGESTRVELSDRRALRCWRRFMALFLPHVASMTYDPDVFSLVVDNIVSTVRLIFFQTFSVLFSF